MTSVNGFLGQVVQKWEQRTRQAAWLDDPALWAWEVAGIKMWSKQREFAYSIRDNRATAVAAGHGVGKTFGAALVCCWWMDVHPYRDVFIASTAPSQPQVSLLWDNIRTIKAKIEERYEAGVIDHKLPGYITGDNAWKLDDGTKIGEGRKPPDNKSDVAFQGRHAPYLLAIADEAVGVPGGFLDALGNIATGRNNRQLLIANPTDPTCAMAKIWRDENSQWVRMHISVFDAPTITLEDGFDPDDMADRGMAGQEYIDQKLVEYGGEEDPRYISRVTGQWAFDSGNNLFTEEEIANGINTIVIPDTELFPELGVDVARMGSDSSTVYICHEGEIWETDPHTGKPTKPTGRRGVRIRYLDDWRKAPLVGGTPENPGTAERVRAHALAIGSKVVKIDASGIGAGVVDGMNMQNTGSYYVIEVFGGAAPTDKRAYINARAEQFFRLKQRLNAKEMDLDAKDTELLEELRGIIFEYADRGAIKIESKDSMKKRGVKSPDRADAVWYAAFDVEELINGLRPGKHELIVEEDANLVSAYSPTGYGRPI